MLKTSRFFAITFLVTWGLDALAVAIGRGGATAAPDGRDLAGIVVLAGVFAPAFVALALTWHERGAEAAQALLARAWRPPTHAGWLLFAALFMAAVKLTAALLDRAFTGHWPAFGTTPLLLMAAGTLFSTPVQAGEELGWRGYALPHLAERIGPGPASLVIGVVWAAWHLPFFLWFPASDTFGQSFPLYLAQVTALSVVMAWVYLGSGGSLLTTMLMHAAVNNTKDIVPSTVAGAHDAFALSTSRVAWLSLLLLATVAGVLLVRMRRMAQNGLAERHPGGQP